VQRNQRQIPGAFVSQHIQIASLTRDETCVQKLARLFPSASAVRLPVRVTKIGSGKKRIHEQTVIEFGTSSEVLFASALPLEFEDRIRVMNSDGSFDVQATVVAVRYYEGQKAVAARFAAQVQNWIIKP
jgi:hypothetical protein